MTFVRLRFLLKKLQSQLPLKQIRNLQEMVDRQQNSINTFIKRTILRTTSDLNLRKLIWVEIDTNAQSLFQKKTLVIVVKNYTKVDSEVFWYCPILLDFFTLFQIFCPGLYTFIIPGKNLPLRVSVLKQKSNRSYVRKQIKVTIFIHLMQKTLDSITDNNQAAEIQGRSI